MTKVPKRIQRIAEFLISEGSADEWETFIGELSGGNTTTILTEYKMNAKARKG